MTRSLIDRAVSALVPKRAAVLRGGMVRRTDGGRPVSRETAP